MLHLACPIFESRWIRKVVSISIATCLEGQQAFGTGCTFLQSSLHCAFWVTLPLGNKRAWGLAKKEQRLGWVLAVSSMQAFISMSIPSIPHDHPTISQGREMVSRMVQLPECCLDPGFSRPLKVMLESSFIPGSSEYERFFSHIVTSASNAGKLGIFAMECQHRCTAGAVKASSGRPKTFETISSESFLNTIQQHHTTSVNAHRRRSLWLILIMALMFGGQSIMHAYSSSINQPTNHPSHPCCASCLLK